MAVSVLGILGNLFDDKSLFGGGEPTDKQQNNPHLLQFYTSFLQLFYTILFTTILHSLSATILAICNYCNLIIFNKIKSVVSNYFSLVTPPPGRQRFPPMGNVTAGAATLPPHG